MAPSSYVTTVGLGLSYYSAGLIAQTFFFGMYTILIFLSTRMLLQRKLNTRVNCVMFGLTTFMYTLSAAYFVYAVADGADRINSLVLVGNNPNLQLPDHTNVTQWSPLFNAAVLINYVLSDGVVVWRAWVICLRNHRKFLWITIFFLAVTALTVLGTIVFRILGTVSSPIDNLQAKSFLKSAIDILQIVTLLSSLLSNLTATGVVSATALRHYRAIRSAFSERKASSTRTNRILILVVETGLLYCISAILVLLSSLIRLPQGTLGDLYTPVNVQIAGAYPCIVLLLVSTERSLSDSTFREDDSTLNGSSSMPSRPIHFMDAGGADKGAGTTPISINFAPNRALLHSQTSYGSRTDSLVLDISREKVQGKDRPKRLSDDSFV